MKTRQDGRSATVRHEAFTGFSGSRADASHGRGIFAAARSGALRLAVLLALVCWQAGMPAASMAADTKELEQALRPGVNAMGRVLPGLDELTGPMSREIQGGKADLHVFYAMIIARMLYEHCQDTLSLMRSAQAQQCPALDAALTQRLGEAALRLEGTAEVIAGSLVLVRSPRVVRLGRAAVEALRLYVQPIKEFADRERQDL